MSQGGGHFGWPQNTCVYVCSLIVILVRVCSHLLVIRVCVNVIVAIFYLLPFEESNRVCGICIKTFFFDFFNFIE